MNHSLLRPVVPTWYAECMKSVIYPRPGEMTAAEAVNWALQQTHGGPKAVKYWDLPRFHFPGGQKVSPAT